MKSKLLYFDRALKWINNNTIDGNGIAVTSRQQVIYPEVTGYYIPTLLKWGERKLALSYAKFLCGIQKKDGSWYDSQDMEPYIFDTAQILKGLISIREIFPEVDEHIIAGCDWMLTCMTEEGRLVTPSKDAWGTDESFCSELIHIYCLTPLRDAGRAFNRVDYIDASNKILDYYLNTKMEQIRDFSLLSHFYAYVMEGLYDLGKVELCRDCMENLEKYQNAKGGIPGLKDVSWVCSTGMFQLALVWYKLGELEKGNRIFYYACAQQNKTGGWYGSYPTSVMNRFYKGRQKAHYFESEEISWANKYFLDALALKEKLEFEKQADSFMDKIEVSDGRYQVVRDVVKEVAKDKNTEIHVCDLACGKGRYLANLIKELPQNKYYAVDISENVMHCIDYVEEKKIGSLTEIPYADNKFDVVYVCEALEHSINLEAAIRELYRVLAPEGKLVIIDKPIEALGKLEIYEWEQWIDDKRIDAICTELGAKLNIIASVAYEKPAKNDGLFRAWIVTK